MREREREYLISSSHAGRINLRRRRIRRSIDVGSCESTLLPLQLLEEGGGGRIAFCRSLTREASVEREAGDIVAMEKA
jgi:hypothetical protein